MIQIQTVWLQRSGAQQLWLQRHLTRTVLFCLSDIDSIWKTKKRSLESWNRLQISPCKYRRQICVLAPWIPGWLDPWLLAQPLMRVVNLLTLSPTTLLVSPPSCVQIGSSLPVKREVDSGLWPTSDKLGPKWDVLSWHFYSSGGCCLCWNGLGSPSPLRKPFFTIQASTAKAGNLPPSHLWVLFNAEWRMCWTCTQHLHSRGCHNRGGIILHTHFTSSSLFILLAFSSYFQCLKRPALRKSSFSMRQVDRRFLQLVNISLIFFLRGVEL